MQNLIGVLDGKVLLMQEFTNAPLSWPRNVALTISAFYKSARIAKGTFLGQRKAYIKHLTLTSFINSCLSDF